jgi:tetratricopeptide (TPR) repeat protein
MHDETEVPRRKRLAEINAVPGSREALGNAFRDQKKLPEAIAAYKKAIDLNPRFANSHAGMGLALRDQGKFREAIEALQTAISLMPPGHPERKFVWSQLKECEQFLALSGVYTQTERQGQLGPKKREQSHPLRMTAGKTYVIEMISPDLKALDPYLVLKDATGKTLAENDDISDNNLNSRIIFTAPKDGNYRIVATSFEQRGSGNYTIIIREFATKKK